MSPLVVGARCVAFAACLVLSSCSTTDSATAPAGRDTRDDVRSPFSAGDPALGGTTFTEVSAEAGLTEPHSELGLTAEEAMTSGGALADVDGDGDLDLFVSRVGRPNSLYLNDGAGRFTDVGQQSGVAGPTNRYGSSAAAFADFDGDGHLDLFAAGYGKGENQLFINNGDGTFREETARRGLVWPSLFDESMDAHHYGASVADFDGDGDMDLLLLQWYHLIYDRVDETILEDLLDGQGGEDPDLDQTPNCTLSAGLREAGFPVAEGTPPTRSALFLNDGSGNFTDGTDEMGLDFHGMLAFTANVVDLDGDGWQDLAITGDGCTSRLFRNEGGRRFTDVTDQAGVGTDENGMGAAVQDVNGDGHPDWFVTSIYFAADGPCPVYALIGCSGNRLYLNNGDGTFRDATDEYGVRDGGWGWGTAIEDFDNDGTHEITMTNGFEEDEATVESYGDSAIGEFRRTFIDDPTRFWVLDPDSGSYRDAAAAVGVEDTTVGHSLIAFDMDGDGDLDLLSLSVNETPRLWRNDTPARNAWLSIGLHDPGTPGNPWGDGARIEVTPVDGDRPIVGWVTTTGSYESQKPPIVHIGLGDHRGPVHRVAVHWPHAAEPQVLNDVPTRQSLQVTRQP